MIVRDAWIFSRGRLLIGFHRDLLVLVGGPYFWNPICPRDVRTTLGTNSLVFLVEKQNDPAIGLDVLEDQVHDDFQHLVHAETAAQGRAELVEDFEIGHGDGGGFGDGQDHRIVRSTERCA